MKPYLYPHPTKPGVLVSRQRIKQLKWVAAGRCCQCGAPRHLYAKECDGCAIKRRERAREKRGGQPWRPGHSGRKPFTALAACDVPPHQRFA